MNRDRKPRISVVIPTISDVDPRLLDMMETQTWMPDEMEIVRGIKPNGRARNLGISRTAGNILVLIDDDAIPAGNQLIEKLVRPLLCDRGIGATGASRLIPPDSNRFQRWTARQVARIENPVVSEPRETAPTAENYFYSDITTTCCALRREVFAETGGFDEELERSVDVDFFIRLSQAGYRLRLVQNLWVYHHAPKNINALLHKQFYYGLGHAQEVARYPDRARGPEKNPLLYILFRSLAFIPHIFLPYSYSEPNWQPGFKPLKALASYASALGYTWGSLRMKPQ
jgi:GT2 family glycosyltransferase